jgi:hypothetical protein
VCTTPKSTPGSGKQSDRVLDEMVAQRRAADRAEASLLGWAVSSHGEPLCLGHPGAVVEDLPGRRVERRQTHHHLQTQTRTRYARDPRRTVNGRLGPVRAQERRRPHLPDHRMRLRER